MKAKSINRGVLSILLVIVMLVSCWVFTAPKTKAASTQYYWRVKVQVQNSYNRGMTHDAKTITVYCKSNNGTGSDVSGNNTFSLSKNAMDPGKGKTAFDTTGGPCNGFPYKVGFGGLKNKNSIYDAHLYCYFWVRGAGQSDWTLVFSSEYMTIGSGSTMSDWNASTANYPRPTSDGSESFSNVTFPKSGSATCTTTATSTRSSIT